MSTLRYEQQHMNGLIMIDLIMFGCENPITGTIIQWHNYASSFKRTLIRVNRILSSHVLSSLDRCVQHNYAIIIVTFQSRLSIKLIQFSISSESSENTMTS